MADDYSSGLFDNTTNYNVPLDPSLPAAMPTDASSYGAPAQDFSQYYDPSSFVGYQPTVSASAAPAPAAPASGNASPAAMTDRQLEAQAEAQGAPLSDRSQQAPAAAKSATDSVTDWLSKLMKGDKTTSGQAKLGLGALGLLSSLMQKKKGASLAAVQQVSPYSAWTPQQQASADAYFNTPIAKRTGMAVGGLAQAGAVPQGMDPSAMGGGPPPDQGQGPPQGQGPFSGFVQGPGGGQDDIIPVNLSAGEYVVDADTVSMIGDGNTDQGAQLLDQWREQLRAAKRGAPPDQIPPQAADVAPGPQQPQGGPPGMAAGGLARLALSRGDYPRGVC